MWRRTVSGLLCACLLLQVTSCDESAAKSGPASPDDAVRAIFAGLADHQPAVVWDAMPASWQADANGIFHLAVSQQEPELYDRSFAVMRRITAALHRNDVLRQAIRARVVESDQLEPEFLDLAEVGLADLAAVSRVLGESDMRTHTTASKADLGDVLRKAGPELMPIAFRWIDQAQTWMSPDVVLPVSSSEWQRLREVRVATVSLSDDTARVEVQLGDRRWPLDLVLVEGKWVPPGVVSRWSSNIDQQRAFLEATFVPLTQQERELQLIKLEAGEAFATVLEQARTLDDLYVGGLIAFTRYYEQVAALGPLDDTAMQERRARFVTAMGYTSEAEMAAAMMAQHSEHR